MVSGSHPKYWYTNIVGAVVVRQLASLSSAVASNCADSAPKSPVNELPPNSGWLTYECKVAALLVMMFAPSMISISPLFGQFGPNVQTTTD